MRPLIISLLFTCLTIGVNGGAYAQVLDFVKATADIVLIKGKRVHDATVEKTINGIVVKYQNGEKIPFEEIGYIYGDRGEMLLEFLFDPGTTILKRIIDYEQSLLNCTLIHKSYVGLGKIVQPYSYKLGNVFSTLKNQNVLKMNIDVVDIPQGYDNGIFFMVSNISIEPEEVKEANFLGYELLIFSRLVSSKGDTTMLPVIRTEINGQISCKYKFARICDDLSGDNIYDALMEKGSHIEFHAALCQKSPYKEIADCDLIPGFNTDFFKPYDLKAVQNDGKIVLNWKDDDPEVEYYKIYRKQKHYNEFSGYNLLDSTDNAIKSYIDENVYPFNYYYYKITSVKNGEESKVSTNEAYLFYKHLYSLDSLLDILVVKPLEKYVFSGSLKSNVLGELLNNKNVYLKFNGSDQILSKTFSDNKGSFSLTGFSSIKDGLYDMTIGSFFNGGGIEKKVYLEIEEDESKGHDIEVKTQTDNFKGIPVNKTLSFAVNLKNNGDSKETGTLSFKLTGEEDGSLVSEKRVSFSLDAGQSQTFAQDFTLDSLENKLCYVSAESSGCLDYIKSNNYTGYPVFVTPVTSNVCYRLENYSFTQDDNTWSRSIYGHSFEIIDYGYFSVTFSLDGDTVSTGIDDWFFNNDRSLLIQFQGSSDYNGGSVYMRIGTYYNQLRLSSFDELGVSGDTLRYTFTIPSDHGISGDLEYIISNTDVETWDQTFWRVNGLSYSRQLSLVIPPNIPASDRTIWVKMESVDNEYWWVQKLYLRVRTPFDIALSDLSVNNNVDSDTLTIIGDVLNYTATVRNLSDYNEYSQHVEFRVEKDGVLLFDTTKVVDIDSFSSKIVGFVLPTLGLETGKYKISVIAPKSYDKSPEDNVQTKTLNIIEPPKLTFNLSYLDTEAFIVNYTKDVFIDVYANGNPVTDCDVNVELKTPEGYKHYFKCAYDTASNKYKFPFKPVIGGVYTLKVTANKIRHVGKTETVYFPVYSYLYLNAKDTMTRVGAKLEVEVSSELIGDLNGLSFELNYDKDKLKYLGYEISEVFDENENNIHTIVRDLGGAILVGITNLEGNGGINIVQRTRIMTFHFNVVNSGSARFEINDHKGITSTGKEILFIGDDTKGEVAIEPNFVYPRFILDKDTLKEYDTCNVILRLSNQENIGSVSGTIVYDTSLFKITDLDEGGLLNEYGAVNTIKVFNEESPGRMHFGISRTDTDKGLYRFAGDLLNFKLIALKRGGAAVTLTDLQAFPPNGFAEYSSSDAQTNLLIEALNPDSIYVHYYPDTIYVESGEDAEVALVVDSLNDAFAFSGTLYFQNTSTEILSLEEGTLFNEDNSVETSFMTSVDNDEGKVIIGLSRLGQIGDVSISDPDTIFKIKLKGLTADTFNLQIPDAQMHLNNGTVKKSCVFKGGVVVVINKQDTVTQTINLKEGWNIISFAVYPKELSMDNIFDQIKGSGILVKIQDEEGNAMENLGSPIGWINNIGDMSPTEGYKIKVDTDYIFSLTGKKVDIPFSIGLSAGWNIMGYPLLTSQNALDAFNSLISDGFLVKVQDEKGNAIEDLGNPIGWIDNINNLESGKGYKVKVSLSTSIVLDEVYNKSFYYNNNLLPEHFMPVFDGNGYDHMNVYVINASSEGVSFYPGDEIAVFDGDVCVGVGVVDKIDQNLICINASCDDPTTDKKDGFTEGNEILLKSWNAATQEETNILDLLPVSGGKGVFKKFGTVIYKPELVDSKSTELGVAYPNPASINVTIPFYINSESNIILEIYDITGRCIKTLINSVFPAGNHNIVWDLKSDNGERIKPGMYMCKFICNKNIIRVNRIIIK